MIYNYSNTTNLGTGPCCPGERRDTQLSVYDPKFGDPFYEPPSPEKIKKSISVQLSGLTSVVPHHRAVVDPLLNGFITLYVRKYYLWEIGENFFPVIYASNNPDIINYLNLKEVPITVDDLPGNLTFEASLKIRIDLDAQNNPVVLYTLNLKYSYPNNPFPFGNHIYYEAALATDYASISSGAFFNAIPELVTPIANHNNYGYPASITCAFSQDSYNFLPQTLTITKKPSQQYDYQPRGWTTNDFTGALPETITLNKVSEKEYSSDFFVLAGNISCKVLLRLTCVADEPLNYYTPTYARFRFLPPSDYSLLDPQMNPVGSVEFDTETGWGLVDGFYLNAPSPIKPVEILFGIYGMSGMPNLSSNTVPGVLSASSTGLLAIYQLTVTP